MNRSTLTGIRMGLYLIALFVLGMLFLSGCGGDDDDDDNDNNQSAWPETYSEQPSSLPEGDDDDDIPFDDDDDDEYPPASPNPNAKADAFRLFYNERTHRAAVSYNRFGLAGDAGFGSNIGKTYIAKEGNEYEIVMGPNDNNSIGYTTYNFWKMYQALGGRTLELSLIRMFEGLVFTERVTGHDGITVREALPGWTRVMDGQTNTITRTRMGEPIIPPAAYPPELENEILGTFYDGLVFTYRENPEEYYFNFKAVNEMGQFASTFVFDMLPDFLRISDCCSSWKISQKGMWEGAFWGNHNSRDNFTDYVMGYLAAFEAEQAEGLPEDLAQAAKNAADAGRRTGDRILSDGYILMTVDEWHDYDTLVPAGDVRPDGETEWQDLGRISSCQMAYAAKAISTEGLRAPVPEVPLPGAIEMSAIKALFEMLGINLPPPSYSCTSVDDAFIGMTWDDILNLQILGMPWQELTEIISTFAPDLFFNLFDTMMDDFQELELGSVTLCLYAQTAGDQLLYEESRKSLRSLVTLQQILAELLYGTAADSSQRTTLDATFGKEEVDAILESADRMLYVGATFARMFDIEAPLEDFKGFDYGNGKISFTESYLTMNDTSPWAMKTDEEILETVEEHLTTRDPWIADRYRERFGYNNPPIRRNGDGYECLGPDEEWMPTENSRHVWFGVWKLWQEGPLCMLSPKTLDCSWAKLGCAQADLDASGLVDTGDQALFDAAWSSHGEGATCSPANGWCDGADLDQSGTLDTEDSGYMAAADGCWYETAPAAQ